jgi:DNA-binding NarL/FixJ family response regulator
MIQVAIVEDVEEIRKGLSMIINAADGVECKHTFSTGDNATQILSLEPVDVVLMDINLPGKINGIECVQRLKSIHPQMQFMMCTSFEDSELIFKALKAGATGYILKSIQPSRLIEAINEIYAGGSPMSAQIARKVISSFHKPAAPEPTHLLSKRELELLELLSKGYRYKDIAEKLFLSIETIRTHIRNIYRKLQVQSRTEALNKTFPRDH